MKKKKLVEWDEQCQKAFDTLKDLCTSTPILAYADYKKEFQLHMDACENARKEALRLKQRYDKMAKTSKLEPGNLVLVRRKGFQEKHKISDRWKVIPMK